MIAVTVEQADLAGHRITTRGRNGRAHTASCLCASWAAQAPTLADLDDEFLRHAAMELGVCWACGQRDDRTNRDACYRCRVMWWSDRGVDPHDIAHAESISIDDTYDSDDDDPADALAHGLDRAYSTLGAMPAVYAAAWPHTLVVSLAGVDPSRGSARSGRPGSKLPRGGDVEIRRLLVTAGQRIATAHMTLADSDIQLHARPRRRFDGLGRVAAWTGTGQPAAWLWHDPTDLCAHPLLPATFEDAALRLRAAAAELHRLDLDDHAVARPARQLVAETRRADKALAGTGTRPLEHDPRGIRRCSRPRCRIAVHADGLCREHYDAERRCRVS